MPEFSAVSQVRLATCHPRLIQLFEAVVLDVDCTILEGHRAPERQLKLYREGRSKVMRGKHNEYPSKAVDVAPYPVDFEDVRRFELFALVVRQKADELGTRIRWGGDWSGAWDGKGPRPAQSFDDLVHFELV